MEQKKEGTGTKLESVEELLNAPEQHHPKENLASMRTL